ncbi:MAG: ATP-binding protein [Coriobacteriia bacterium]|nr:ATP-binding protein [Coriobacteriia bacterium]
MARFARRFPLLPDSLRARLSGTIVLASLLLFGIVFGATKIAASAFTRSAVVHDASRTLTTARAILDAQAATLDSFAVAYTEWDEFYDRTVRPDDRFIAEEFDPWLRERSGADAVLWIAASGTTVFSYGDARDLDALRRTARGAASPLVGPIALPSGLAVVSVRPIVGSPVRDRAAGWLAVARRVQVAALADALGLGIVHEEVSERFSGEGSIGAVDGYLSAAAWLRGDAFEARGTIAGVNGAPAGTLVLEEPLRGDPVLSSWTFPFAMGLISLVVGLGFGLALSRTVVMPLSRTLALLRQEGLRAVQGEPPAEFEPDDPLLPAEFRDFSATVHELVTVLHQRERELEAATDQALAAEQALRTVLDESAEAKMLVQRGVVEVANPAFAACVGRPLGLMLHQPLEDLLAAMDIASPEGEPLTPAELIERALENEVVVRCNAPTHGERWMEVRADTTAVPDAFVLTARDVTEQYRLEQLRSEIVSLVSHDLRAPLTVLAGYLDMLVRDLPAEQRERIVASMREAVDRMHALVEDLLDSARAQKALGPSVIAPVDLATLATQAAGAVRIAFGRPVTVVVRSPATVAGDPKRLRQALDNLLVNAVKHAPAESDIRIVVDRAGARALLAVEDTGPGVPPEAREAVFERFAQLGTSEGGSGLGLYIVRTIAETHDGRAYVEDAPGGGARFVIDLPAAAKPSRTNPGQRGREDSSNA